MKVNIEIPLENIKTVKVNIRKRKGHRTGTFSIPKDVILREDLQDKEDVVIFFLGKSRKEGGEDFESYKA